jgi:pimeloyl-ACP methyl ester carboxylesterase
VLPALAQRFRVLTAARHPELVRSVAAHEPTLFALFVDDPDDGPAMREALGRFELVATQLVAGDTAGGTRQFAETVAYGPGAWPIIPPQRRQVMVGNAPTWVDEMRDPGAWTADLAALEAIPCPILLTRGDQSLPFWARCVTKLAELLPNAQTRVIAGAGHVPQASHPAEYAAAVSSFFVAADTANSAGPG